MSLPGRVRSVPGAGAFTPEAATFRQWVPHHPTYTEPVISRSEFAALNRRVRRVEALLEAIAARLEIPVEEIAGGRPPGVSADVVALAAEGRKIAAIKLLREQQRDLDLASAKRIVDEL